MRNVVGRANRGRATLMHFSNDGQWSVCGCDMRRWSRAYPGVVIKQILCRRCAKFAGVRLP